MKITIAGGGIGGLTLALLLHKNGIECEVYEAASEIAPLGLGINLLPHCTRVLDDIGLTSALENKAVITKEAVFFNRYGQLIYREPAGKWAGYKYSQFSVHRADLHNALLKAFDERIGNDKLHLGHKATGFEQSDGAVTVHFEDTDTGQALGPVKADIAIGADGLHSAFRKQLHPNEGAPIYSGVKMWRGAAITPPCLTGASMARAGWLTSGKMVIYPIRDNVDGKGNQLMNWAAELETTDSDATVDWDKVGKLDELHATFGDWNFDWLDVGKMILDTENVLETPMVDQDALPFWTKGAVTLLGDAAHPMYPRGSNGAAQAILDADFLAGCLGREEDALQALKTYEKTRLPVTAKVVMTNRENPPDAIIREVFERTGDKPFDNIEDVISQDELTGIADNYRKIVGINSNLMST